MKNGQRKKRTPGIKKIIDEIKKTIQYLSVNNKIFQKIVKRLQEGNYMKRFFKKR